MGAQTLAQRRGRDPCLRRAARRPGSSALGPEDRAAMSRAPAAWQRFVLAHGWHARGHVLAAVLGQPVADVEHVRRTRACTRLKTGKRFAELFSLWHGRAPNDVDWPTPWKGAAGVYEWQAPELALLASLVGRMGGAEISRILTTRLRLRTG